MEVCREKQGKIIDKELQGTIKKMLAKGETSQKDIAVQIGYSTSSVNLYLNKDTFVGDIDKIENELKKFIKVHNDSKKYERVELQFIKTRVTERIYSVANMCRANGEICMCYGQAGVGKTISIRKYAQENSGVIIISPSDFSNARSVLMQIVEKLKIVTATSHISDITAEIQKKLKGSNYLVIIDEAENLNSEIMRRLRNIHDYCEFTFGLLLVGTDRLYKNLKSLRGDFSYLFTRIAYKESLCTIDEKDIAELTRQIYPDANLEVIKAFERHSGKNTRVLFNLLKRTHDLLYTSKKEISPRVVEAAKELIF